VRVNVNCGWVGSGFDRRDGTNVVSRSHTDPEMTFVASEALRRLLPSPPLTSAETAADAYFPA
jgi:hypothetical protein